MLDNIIYYDIILNETRTINNFQQKGPEMEIAINLARGISYLVCYFIFMAAIMSTWVSVFGIIGFLSFGFVKKTIYAMIALILSIIVVIDTNFLLGLIGHQPVVWVLTHEEWLALEELKELGNIIFPVFLLFLIVSISSRMVRDRERVEKHPANNA